MMFAGLLIDGQRDTNTATTTTTTTGRSNHHMFVPSPPMTSNSSNTEEKTKRAEAPVKRKVGRPGRKRIDTEAKNKRTQQNRAAQRAYRERKENKLKKLENKIHWLEQLNIQNAKESEYVVSGVERLINELNKYRPTNSEDNQLLDFLNQSGQIKSGIKSELAKAEKKPTNIVDDSLNDSNTNDNNVNANNNNNLNSSSQTENNPSPVTSSSSHSSNIYQNNQSPKNEDVNNLLDVDIWSSLLLKKQDDTNHIPDFCNTWDSNESVPIITNKLPSNNTTQQDSIWNSTHLPQDIHNTTTNLFDFNNTYEVISGDNNILSNLAFPDIWMDPSVDNIDNLNSPIVSIATTVPNMDLPLDCTCNGACFTSPSSATTANDINNNNNNNSINKKNCDGGCESDNESSGPVQCELLTRHLINHESIHSVLNDRQFLENAASHCSHFINNVKLQNQLKSYDNNNNNKSFEAVVEDLCNELMVKCIHDPIQNSIILDKKDVRNVMLTV